ncbi:hypothetical protein RCO48_29660 [Peribacillus frigoritolerans]|nr:hypothetical protein [Peribacillus frigoritolerans]
MKTLGKGFYLKVKTKLIGAGVQTPAGKASPGKTPQRKGAEGGPPRKASACRGNQRSLY